MSSYRHTGGSHEPDSTCMDSLIVIFVAVGALGILVWLLVSTMRDSHTGSPDSSTNPTDLGDGTSHSHDSGDSGGGGDGGD